MIKIKKKIKQFVTILKILKDFNLETTFTFTPEGINVFCVDISNISLIQFKINKSLFEEYIIAEEATYSFDMESFLKVVKKVGKKEMTMDIQEDGFLLSNGTDNFKLTYFVGNKDVREMPAVVTTSEWNINTEELFEQLGGMFDFSYICEFKADETLELHTKDMKVKGSAILSAEKVQSDVCSCYYDLNYFNKIKDLASIFDKMNFKFGNATSCILEGNNEDINVKWLLAGRVDNE